MSALLAAVSRPSHRTITTDTGTRVRITRWAPGARRRDVYRVMPDGALVELGHVIDLGGHVCMAYPAVHGEPGWGCDTYVGGARLLADRLDVQPVTVYTVSVHLHSDTEEA